MPLASRVSTKTVGETFARRALTCAVAIGVTSLLVASGWAIAEGHTKTLFIAIAAIGLCILALTQRGVFIGLFLVAAMNGLPFINTAGFISAKFTLQDGAITVLLMVLVIWVIFDNGSYQPSRAGRTISCAAAILLLWWCLTVARTVIDDQVPLLRAAAFGRDFLYFSLLLIVLPRVRLTNRDIGMLLIVLAAGVSLFAVGQIATATGAGFPAALIHVEHTLQQAGLTRVYARMTDLVNAALAMAIAASLLTRQRIVRSIALPLVLLLTTSVAVQLTRARWIGLIAGFLIVSVWFIIQNDTTISTLLRRRLALAAGVIFIVGVGVIVTDPSLISGDTLQQRLLSLFSQVETHSGSVGIREAATNTTTHYLGEQWLLGLGLVPASSHYFLGLPEGSIRDADLGALNAVTTIGVVGAILIYVPVLFMLFQTLRRRSAALPREYDWIRYGGAIWITAALVSSATLVTLFSISGLALTAVFLAILAHPSVSGALAWNDRCDRGTAPNFVLRLRSDQASHPSSHAY